MSGQYETALAEYDKLIELSPNDGHACNSLAWLLVTCPNRSLWNANRAVTLATKATELIPEDGNIWNTLGVAQYRAADLTIAIKSLSKSVEKLGDAESPVNDFFLAMSHWRLGDHDEAHKWYEKAVKWMSDNKSTDVELLRFRAEAEETLGIEPEAPVPEKSDVQSPEAVISSKKHFPPCIQN